MRIACFQSCACTSYCFEAAKRMIGNSCVVLKEIQQDPESLQKLLILGLSVFRGINLCRHTDCSSPVLKILELAQSFDFYGFCKLPRYLFHLYTPERIDEYLTLIELEKILCENWNQAERRGVHQFAKNEFKAFLNYLSDERLDFQTEEQFKEALYIRFQRSLQQNPRKGLDPYSIDLRNLKISIKPQRWILTLTDVCFVFVDLATVLSFFQNWSLINLSLYANRLSGVKILSWVPNQVLDDWILGAMSTGHLIRFIDKAMALQSLTLTEEERKANRALMVASLAESIYCFSLLCKKEVFLVTGLAIIAKSIGIYSSLNPIKPTFFTRHDSKTSSL